MTQPAKVPISWSCPYCPAVLTINVDPKLPKDVLDATNRWLSANGADLHLIQAHGGYRGQPILILDMSKK